MLIVVGDHKAAGSVGFLVRQQADFAAGHGLLADGGPEHGGVEGDGAVEISDGNVGPAEGVVHGGSV